MYEPDSLIGLTLGPYEIRSVVAAGNMNIVYEAYDPVLKRSSALRMLQPAFREQAAYIDAFLQEAQLIARLEHPHIVPIHAYGQEGNYHYMVYRLLTGGSLKRRLEKGILSLQEAATILKQLASALDYIHSQNLVHGEMSRSNILFDAQGNPYLVNLFFANLRHETEVVHASQYLAPERWQNSAPTPASDQYALGIVTYQMVTGQKPFTGSNAELHQKHLHELPPAPQQYRPDVPQAVNRTLDRALAKQPSERYPTAMDFARDFEKAVQNFPTHLFISYSRSDKAYADTLFDHLGQNGFTPWIDRQIEYGDMWFREIDEAIKTCAAFLVLMSPAAYESEWVQKEILLAKRYKKPIFPLLLAGDEFGILIDIQFADVRGGALPNADFLRRLRRAVYGDL
jgi:serine/threonine protein kinase